MDRAGRHFLHRAEIKVTVGRMLLLISAVLQEIQYSLDLKVLPAIVTKVIWPLMLSKLRIILVFL